MHLQRFRNIVRKFRDGLVAHSRNNATGRRAVAGCVLRIDEESLPCQACKVACNSSQKQEMQVAFRLQVADAQLPSRVQRLGRMRVIQSRPTLHFEPIKRAACQSAALYSLPDKSNLDGAVSSRSMHLDTVRMSLRHEIDAKCLFKS